MAFPASPADNATTLINGVTYVYSLANVSWSPYASNSTVAYTSIAVSGNSSVTGTETVGTLSVTGSETVSGNLTVTGNLTVNGSGNIVLGTLNVTGSTNFSAGSVVYSANQQTGRSYEAHDFNSYPNLYSTIFINSGASTNVPSGFTGMGYRFIMGAGDTLVRGFELVGSSEPTLYFRERSNGVWNKVLSKTAGSLTSAAYAVSNATAITVNTATPTAICSVTITCSGKPVFITASGDGNPNQSGGWHILQIYKDGSGIGKFIINENAGGTSKNCPWALTHIDVPTAGSHTYAVYAWQGSGSFLYGESGDVQAPTIAVMEIV